MSESTEDVGLYDVLGPDGALFEHVTLPRVGRFNTISGRFFYSVILHEERDHAVYRYALSE